MGFRAAATSTGVTLFLAASLAGGAVAGKYSDGNLTVDLSGSDPLTGTIALGSNKFPATAHANGDSLDGSFTASGNTFPFTAQLTGDTLTLTSGGKTYTLNRAPDAGNPLGGAAGSAGDLPNGYSVVTTTEFGKSLFAQKTDVTTVTAALQAALPDLGHYFDGKPDIKGAYEDSKNHQSGGALFTASLKGEPMKGVVSCKLLDQGGAAITVVYCKQDAPQAEWAKLSAAPQAPADAGTGGAAPTAAPSAADIAKVLGDNAQEIQFGDGTGSITVPDGWKADARSALSPTHIQGPADQSVYIGNNLIISSPDSQYVKMVEQNQERMREMGGNPPPPPQMIVAEFTDPVQAMQDIYPQFSKINQARGAPAVQLDKIVDHKDIPCTVEGGKQAEVTLEVTRTTSDGISKQYRVMQRVAMLPMNGGSWSLTLTGFTAPEETFDQYKKVMFAILQSEKINEQMVSQRMNQMSQQNMQMIKQQGEASSAALQASHDAYMKSSAQQYADHQQQMADTQAGYDAHNQQFRDDMVTKARNKDDVVEQIQGYRQVYDTQTGLSASVDLNDVNGVVNSLNQAALDPNRFVQIPLRDLQDPR